MNPSTSLGTRSNVGIAKPSPPVRQAGNIWCLLVIREVYRRSVPSGCAQVKYRCRCRGMVHISFIHQIRPALRFYIPLKEQREVRISKNFGGIPMYPSPLKDPKFKDMPWEISKYSITPSQEVG